MFFLEIRLEFLGKVRVYWFEFYGSGKNWYMVYYIVNEFYFNNVVLVFGKGIMLKRYYS